MARGLCSPEQQAACPLTKHFSDNHHLYYEKRMYKTPTERAFRELPENQVQLCRNEHNEIHATQPIPEKPSRDVMLQALASAAIGEPHVEETPRPAIYSGYLQANVA